MAKKTQKPKNFDNSWLGNMNAACVATLFKGRKMVGTCMDTPNAVAFAMNQTGATKAVSRFSKFKKGNQEGFERKDKDGFTLLSPSRIESAGWLKNAGQACLVLL